MPPSVEREEEAKQRAGGPILAMDIDVPQAALYTAGEPMSVMTVANRRFHSLTLNERYGDFATAIPLPGESTCTRVTPWVPSTWLFPATLR